MRFVHAQAFISRRNDSGTQRRKIRRARVRAHTKTSSLDIADKYRARNLNETLSVLKRGEKLPRSQLTRVSLLP